MAHAISLKNTSFIPSLYTQGLASSSGFVSKIYEGYAQFIQDNGAALAQALGNCAGKLTRGILFPFNICQLGRNVQNKLANGVDYTTQLPIRLFARALIDIHWIAMAGGLSTAIASAFFGMELLPIALLATSIYLSSLIYKQFSSSISSSIEKSDEKRSGFSGRTPSSLKEREMTLDSFDTFAISSLIVSKILPPSNLANFFYLYGIIALPSTVIPNPPYWFRLGCYSGLIFRFATVDFTLTSKLVGSLVACEAIGMLAKKGIATFVHSSQYHHLKNAIETKFSNIQIIFTKSKSS